MKKIFLATASTALLFLNSCAFEELPTAVQYAVIFVGIFALLILGILAYGAWETFDQFVIKPHTKAWRDQFTQEELDEME